MPSTCVLTWKIDGKRRHHRLETGSAVLGRDTQCEIIIDRDTISRRHAVFARGESGWYVSDLGSRNGVYVDGQRLEEDTKIPLEDGQQIMVGTVELACGLTRGSPSQARIELSDALPQESIARSIRMDDLAAHLSSDSGRFPASSTSSGVAIQEPVDVTSVGLPLGMPLLEMFQTAAETLLSGNDLDTMLGKALELVFRSLPRVERGYVCLLDSDGQLVPRASRTLYPNQTESLRISRTVTDAAILEKEAVLIQDTRLDERFNTAESIVALQIRSVMCAPLYQGDDVAGIIYVDTTAPGQPFGEEDLRLLSTLSMLSAVAVEQARMREDMEQERRRREHLGRYLDKHVIELLLAGESDSEQVMQTREAEITVFFADIVGFTGLSEKLSAVEVTAVLNETFGILTDVLFEHQGTLDKYNGDEMIAFFGAPRPQEDQADRAVRTCLQMQKALQELNERRGDEREPLRMRIGINTGLATVGDIGHPDRRDYTVIGDVVNTAKRLESIVCEPGQVVIGPATRERLTGEEFVIEELPEAELKGKSKRVRPFRVSL